MNTQLRELLTIVLREVCLCSPATDELQSFLCNYDREFEVTRKKLIEAEALLAELERAGDIPRRAGKPVSGKQTINTYVEIAPKLLPVLLHHLSDNGYFKFDMKAFEDFQKSGRVIACKEKTDGLHLFLLDAEEAKRVTKQSGAREEKF
jgi:hypothetical protein